MANDVLDLKWRYQQSILNLNLKMPQANDTLLKGHKMHDEHYFKY